MYVKKAKRVDFGAVHHLVSRFNKMSITPDHFNNRDIALIARNESGACIGFIWAGLMCNGTQIYVDKFAVDPACKGQGVGRLLAQALLDEAVKRGIRVAIAAIKQDQYHDASAINALRLGMASDGATYTFVHASVDHSVAELRALEA